MGIFDWLGKTRRKSTEELLAEARALTEASRFEEAVRVYSRIRRSDRTPPILAEIARACLSSGQDWIALQYASEALDLNPGCAAAICIQGEVLLRENRKSEAKAR